MRFLFQNQKSY